MNLENEQRDSLINYLRELEDRSSRVSSRATDNDTCSSEEQEDVSEKFDELVNLAGQWGIHRLQKHSWHKSKKTTVPIKRFEDLSLNELNNGGILTEQMIAPCLSFAEKSPILLNYAYCKCVLREKELLDISVLKTYNYLQYLDLARNNLTSLNVLGQLPFLQYLDASDNHIEHMLDFQAPFFLSYVDLSNNCIEVIPDLTSFWSITTLKLSGNNICKISGLERLRFLTHLDLSSNNITKLENLNNLRIQKLLLNNNSIEEFEDGEDIGIHTLHFLKSVDLSNNKMNSLKLFKRSDNLESLKLANNNIKDLLELYYLRNLRFLINLSLVDNPISEHPEYTNVCIRLIESLRILDNLAITPEKRVSIKFKKDINPTLMAREDRMYLLLLEQINDPVIGAHIVPCDQPPPCVIMIVGPVGSNKKFIAMEFVKRNKRTILGISYTTRKKLPNEQNGLHYYFVDKSKFRTMMINGEFLTVSESYGHLFGITHRELEKCRTKILVFHSDLSAALIMKTIGLCPKLVLAMPRTTSTHLGWLKRNYFFTYVNSNSIMVQKCSESKTSLISDNEKSIDSISLNDPMCGEANQNVEGNLHVCRRTEYEDGDRDIHFQGIMNNSETNNDAEEGLQKTSIEEVNKSAAGILKNKSSSKENEKPVAVSFFEEYESCLPNYMKEELEDKKVSFSWFPDIDWNWFEGAIRHKSISRTMFEGLITENTRKDASFEYPILSVLSSQNMNLGGTNQETVYMTLTERLEQMHKEHLEVFFQSVMQARDELLQLHWENPGLFRDIIFTDELEESFTKLKSLLKITIDNHNSPRENFNFAVDPVFQEMLKSKIQSLDLENNKYFQDY